MTLAPTRPPSKRKSPRSLPLTAAEFFAGIGLVRLALQNQGWQVLWANDIDPAKAQMYHANFGTEDLHVGDIHLVPAAAIPPCTLYAASFPCNDLSIAGDQAGLNGKQSGAFWGLVKILRDMVQHRSLKAIHMIAGG
jgi:DNA (cytosine-5)-methyltransferase 1